VNLGHSDVKVTAMYLNATDDSRRRAVAGLDRLLPAGWDTARPPAGPACVPVRPGCGLGRLRRKRVAGSIGGSHCARTTRTGRFVEVDW